MRCVDSAVDHQTDWWEIQENLCGIESHSDSFCGSNIRDIGSLNFTGLKPRVNTPKGLICNWKLSSNTTFDVTIDITSLPDLYSFMIEYRKDGASYYEYDLNASSTRRMLYE